MTSPLTVGLKFRQTGFNKNSTPAKPGTSEDDIATSLPRKLEYPDSPAAGVYDVTNTSSRMILLNNANKAKGGSKLRIEASNERIAAPDPERHLRYKTPQKDPKRHENCVDSSTPQFERPASSLRWANQNQRPAWKPSEESSKNNDRHSSCLVSRDPAFTSLEYTGRARQRQQQRLLIHRQPATQYLHYLVHIAQSYDVAPIRQQRHAHYLRLLVKEEQRGQHTDKEYDSYMRQINKSFLVGQQQSRDTRPNTAASTQRPTTAASTKKSTANGHTGSRSKSARERQSRDHARSSSRSTASTDTRRDSSRHEANSEYRSDEENENEKNALHSKNQRDASADRKKSTAENNNKGEVQSTHVYQRPHTAAAKDRQNRRHEASNDDTNSNSSENHPEKHDTSKDDIENTSSSHQHKESNGDDDKHIDNNEEHTANEEDTANEEENTVTHHHATLDSDKHAADEDDNKKQEHLQSNGEEEGTQYRPPSAASGTSHRSSSPTDKHVRITEHRRHSGSSDVSHT